MRRFCRALLLTAFSTSASSAFAAGFSDLEGWVGSYPVRERQGKTERIFSDPHLRSAMARLLSPGDLRTVVDYQQSLPIELVDGFIVISRCKPRNCAPQRAVVVLDTREDRLWVGLFERTSSKVAVRWFGNKDDDTVIPRRVVERFRENR